MKHLKDDPLVKFEQVTFPLMRMAVARRENWGALMRHYLDLDTYYDLISQSMVAQLSTNIISNEVHTHKASWYKHPITWIDAFKEKYWRFIPNPLKRKFPVQYKHVTTKIDHIHVCPHCDYVPWGDGLHISFMTTDDWDEHSSQFKEKSE